MDAYTDEDIDVPEDAAFTTTEVALEATRISRELYVYHTWRSVLHILAFVATIVNIYGWMTIPEVQSEAVAILGEYAPYPDQYIIPSMLAFFATMGVITAAGFLVHMMARKPQDNERLVYTALVRLTERGGLYAEDE